MTANPEHPRRKLLGTSEQKLKVVLGAEEIRRKHDALIATLSDLAAHEREEAEVKSQLTRKRRGLEARRGDIHQVLVAGYEYRDVTVEKIADYDLMLVRHIRTDTGEEVEVERMPEAVRQTEIDFPPPPKPDGTAARPEDVDGPDDPWGAPSNGVPPAAELPPPEDVIEAEFEDEPGPVEDEPRGGPAADPSIGERMERADRLANVLALIKASGPAEVLRHLDPLPIDDLRAVYALLTGRTGAHRGRVNPATVIQAILAALEAERGGGDVAP